jgi:hypothetical protein
MYDGHLKGVGAGTSKDGCMALVGRTEHTVRKRELETRLQQLPDIRTTHILGCNFRHLDDVDRGESGTMASSHVLV